MPVGTVSIKTTTCRLEKLPPDGFVVIRKMSYGDRQHRSELVSRMHAPMGDRNSERSVIFDTDIMGATLFDFQKCVVDHNITDEDGKQLDLGKAADIAKLDPAVGEEIADLIEKLNEGEDMAPFEMSSGPSSDTATASNDSLPMAAEPQVGSLSE